MTTQNSEHPPAWQRALERFEGGYGCEFDASDPQDVVVLLALLEEEVHTMVTRKLVDSFREATARVEQETARLLGEKAP